MTDASSNASDPKDPAGEKVSAGSTGGEYSSELDLTKDPREKECSEGLEKPSTVPYDPAKDREWARGAIALTLVAILAGMVVLAFAYVLISLFLLKNFRDIDALKTLMEILFSPIVGLVGAVTGFYFGEKSKS